MYLLIILIKTDLECLMNKKPVAPCCSIRYAQPVGAVYITKAMICTSKLESSD
jgi:hypothetical protein